MNKKSVFIASGAIATALVIGGGVEAQAADNPTPYCVTAAEYNAIQPGQTPLKVAGVFGNVGWLEVRSASQHRVLAVRAWRMCDASGKPVSTNNHTREVEVAFVNAGHGYHAVGRHHDAWPK